MAKVKLNLLNIFQLRINKKVIEYEGKTVGDILSKFINENRDKLDAELINTQKKNQFSEYVIILLNGRNIKYLKNYKTSLNDGDELYLSYALAGG
ncbi:MAG: MoaD/ThiS family protein [Candidatus Hermodarchaeota archaeon]